MSELYHYGVLGMKWGVRKDRPKPTKAQRKERKRLTKDVAAAQQNLKKRYKENIASIRNTNMDEHMLEVALDKRVFPWNRKKQDAMIKAAEQRLDKSVNTLLNAKDRYEKASAYESKVSSELVSYVDSLTKKYGKETVKQLGVKNISVGKGYFKKVFPMIKTGIVSENFPIVGDKTRARRRAREASIGR